VLSNLCSALLARFERTGDQADIDDAVTAARDAAAAIPPDHPNRAAVLFNLCAALRARFERTGDQADIDDAVTAGRDAVAVQVAPPLNRAIAGLAWGRAAAAGGRWQEAVAGFAAAADLLGRVAPRSLARGDQEHLLEALGGLGSEAAACCVQAGLADRAVELFEQGRGVLLGQALDTRTDLTALGEQYPELAKRFTALRDYLDSADGGGLSVATSAGRDGDGAETRRMVEQRREAAEAFDRVIAEIRAKPGFDRFIRPSPISELAAAAADGPIVIVNVSRFGSQALILTNGGVEEPIPLAGLTPEGVHEHVAGFLTALDDASWQGVNSSGRASAEERLTDTLSWLWDVAVGPVLDRLGITGPPGQGEVWPRLWWCVSGLLSFLPLHAAGHHGTRFDATPATVIDRVISSSTPTIRALAYARRPRPADPGDTAGIGGRVLAVAMPHTADASDLPGAQAEAAWLQRRFPGQVNLLTGPEATHDAVLAALPAAQWAHFACHGSSDLANPSASGLLLADYQQRPLTVVDVARLRLDDAGLAFLSACSTARPGGRLTDEAINLASAFQLAGYRHVIATLWRVGDQDAVDIAADIYTTLNTATDDAAVAAHAATRRFRRRWPDSPSVWASHIHSGD
jgi:hypothetical protein